MISNTHSETVSIPPTISGEGYKVPQRRRTRKRVMNAQGPRFACDFCAGRFHSEQSLIFHIANYHPPQRPNEYDPEAA